MFSLRPEKGVAADGYGVCRAWEKDRESAAAAGAAGGKQPRRLAGAAGRRVVVVEDRGNMMTALELTHITQRLLFFFNC